jgi:hypothetical protein
VIIDCTLKFPTETLNDELGLRLITEQPERVSLFPYMYLGDCTRI